MSDVAVSAASPAAPAQTGTPKKSAAAAKKPRVKPAHPRTSEMVHAAVKNLKERGGSSLKGIKKYIASHYKVDVEKLAPFIKKYLKSAVTAGALVQTKGKGASGSFKLPTAEKGEAKKKTTAAKPAAKAKKTAGAGAKAKAAKTTKAAKPAAKKLSAKKTTTGAKKASAAKSASPVAAKKAAPAKPAKSPAKPKPKAKKPAKGSPTKKPKTPKPKKATKPKAAAAKKAAPKKK